jgi:hypothetical protein
MVTLLTIVAEPMLTVYVCPLAWFVAVSHRVERVPSVALPALPLFNDAEAAQAERLTGAHPEKVAVSPVPGTAPSIQLAAVP